MFGYQIPKEIIESRGQPRLYWGARAIFEPNNAKNPFQSLPDRMSTSDPDVQYPLLFRWLKTDALPYLRKECRKLSSSSDKIIEYGDGKVYQLLASPQASYGYLYIGAWRYDPEGAAYELKELPVNKQWSGKEPPPKIGDKVRINMNNLGDGIVLDYFHESDYLGVRVLLDNVPGWKKEQQPDNPTAMVFGIELANSYNGEL